MMDFLRWKISWDSSSDWLKDFWNGGGLWDSYWSSRLWQLVMTLPPYEMSRIVYFPLYLPFSASLPLSLARCMTAEPYILSCLPLPGWLALIFSPSFYIFLKIYSRITSCIEICLNVQCHIYPLCVQQCVKVVFMGLIPSPVSRKKTRYFMVRLTLRWGASPIL